MPPSFPHSRGGISSKGGGSRVRGKNRGKGEAFTPKRSRFQTSRLEEDREDSDSQTPPLQVDREPLLDAEAELTDDSSSDGFDAKPTTNSYATLLQALKAEEPARIPARKRRKVSNDATNGQAAARNGEHDTIGMQKAIAAEPDVLSPRLEERKGEDVQEDESDTDADAGDDVSDDEGGEPNRSSIDPYERHFANAESDALSAHLATPPEKRWSTRPTKLIHSVRTTMTLSTAIEAHVLRPPQEMKFKTRLTAKADRLWTQLDTAQRDVAAPILQYMDIVSGARTFQDPAILRSIIALHALDHIFKTRDHIIKNNTRLANQDGSETLDLRDQGFTRPKVLFLLPTRQSCVNFVDTIVSICEPEQQEYKARFQESFGGADDKTWNDKPQDFRDLFGGNDDDMFRIGLKFTRKTIKYFSAFYSSDIIIASPLGLRSAIENSGDGQGKKKGHDADFLSSIEIVVVDHAHALQMQNWQHVEYVFSQLNLLPKEAHGCDFSRVRNWYLDNNSRHLRQTIILSDFLTPEINALSSTHMANIDGKVKYTLSYKGAMLELPPTLPPNTTQTFLRYDSPTPGKDPDARFQHFTSTILASLLRDRHSKGTLIFIPSSFDFIRLRNHFATSSETASLSFAAISEYTSVREVMRARSHFVSGRHSVLLYSERAHHFRRYQLKGVQRIVFYGVPENPIFWAEIVGFLGLRASESEVGGGRGAVRALFSKWDVLKMERIVGTERVKKLVAERGGDTFDFV